MNPFDGPKGATFNGFISSLLGTPSVPYLKFIAFWSWLQSWSIALELLGRGIFYPYSAQFDIKDIGVNCVVNQYTNQPFIN